MSATESILITGAGGYIGSYLVKEALLRNHVVVAVDTFQNGKEGLLGVSGKANLRILKKSIFDLTKKDFENVSKVIHLAAVVGTKDCEERPEEALKTNVEGTKKLLSLCQDKKFYFANTNIGYPSGHSDETAPLKAENVYARTKIEAEKVVLENGGTSFRLGSVFGISPKMRDNLLLHFLVREYVMREKPQIFELDVLRNFIHLDDISRALLRNYPFHKGEAYNLCLAKHYTKRLILLLLGNRAFEEVKDQDPDKRDYHLSVDKAKKHAGFSAVVLIEHVIENLHRYYEFIQM